jgi:hypothetical protein
MPENTIPAIIALIGVSLSVVASVFVSIRQFRIESQKLRNEYLHRYAEKLFDKRLAVYSEVFGPVVSFIQKVNLRQTISPGELEKLSRELTIWNAKNSFFLSARSEQIMHALYIDLNTMTDEEREKLVKNHDSLREFKKRLLEIYIALKGDLGIYALVSPSVITEFKAPTSIREVAELSGLSK